MTEACDLKLVSVYERDRRLMEYLDSLGLRPGASVAWVGRNYDETITLRVDGRAVQLGVPAARRVWVNAPCRK